MTSMASIIPDYNYDIFISYRQKDNKGDRWVSEFVDALKDELESTFKEEISVYFDINPHDGLLETHDVDESLKEKLKCLIFIPIISRTYCDPKSFAWEHEFKAFVEKATKDQFGLKIRLSNGNVASRVLPIQIHDLDNEDIKLCESILGGVFRGVEFSYKSAGINRPLRSTEDKPGDNLNKTYYRDQINISANAIKEIISGLKSEPSKSVSEQNEVLLTVKKPVTTAKSIIVLPFENMSPDPDQDYFSDGLTEEIITDLSHINDLLVISRSSAMTYKGTNKKISEIAAEVNVHYVLEGSVRKAGKNLRITAQLINAMSDTHLWAEKYTGTLDDVFNIQEKVSRSIVNALKIKLNHEEKKPTANLRAYDLYLLGRYYWNRRTEEGLYLSIEYFEQAINLDQDYALAYAGLSDAYYICADWNYLSPLPAYQKAIEFAQKAVLLDNNIAEAYATLGIIACNFEFNYDKAESHFQTALTLNPNYATAHQWYAVFLTVMGRFDEASTQINLTLQLDPLSPIKNYCCGLLYYFAEAYDNAISQYKETLKLDPEFPLVSFQIFLCHFQKGLIVEAISEYQKLMVDDSSLKTYKKNAMEIYNSSGTIGFLNYIIDLELNSANPHSRVLAILFALSGDNQKALDYIEYNVTEYITDFIYLNVEPAFINLRSEPRFLALLQRIGLDQ